MPEYKKHLKYSAECFGVVHLLEFCPFEWSCNLLAVGSGRRVFISSCRFEEEDNEVDGIECRTERDYHHNDRITAFAWSPETSILAAPKVVRFCTAGSENKVKLYTSDLKSEDGIRILGEHKNYINALCFDPEKGELVGSTSDDHTCKVWSITQGEEVACFSLQAPGMAISWHPEEHGKIMVAEKKGIIRFYNVFTQQPIMSLDCGHMPLYSADWSHGDPLQVAALAACDLFLFNTSRSSPLESTQAHSEGGKVIRWSRSHDHLLATTGRPSQLKVVSIKTGQTILSVDSVIANGLSWHHRLPIVAVGGDQEINFYSVEQV